MEVLEVVSARLRLVWMSPQFMQLSLDDRCGEAERLLGTSLPAGWPDQEMRRLFGLFLEQLREAPEEAPWLARAMLRREDGAYLGNIGFHGKPNAQGQAELGYFVEPAFRRRGYATEAIQALMDWARSEQDTWRFIVSIAPSNEASLLLAVKMGFRQVGTKTDETEGEEYVFELVVED